MPENKLYSPTYVYECDRRLWWVAVKRWVRRKVSVDHGPFPFREWAEEEAARAAVLYHEAKSRRG